MRKSTESADKSYWEITESRLTTRPPEYRCQWRVLDSICDNWQWDQDLTLMHELTFWSPFSMERYLAQPRYWRWGRGLVLPQWGDGTYLVEFLRGGLILTFEQMGGVGGKVGKTGVEGGETDWYVKRKKEYYQNNKQKSLHWTVWTSK